MSCYCADQALLRSRPNTRYGNVPMKSSGSNIQIKLNGGNILMKTSKGNVPIESNRDYVPMKLNGGNFPTQLSEGDVSMKTKPSSGNVPMKSSRCNAPTKISWGFVGFTLLIAFVELAQAGLNFGVQREAGLVIPAEMVNRTSTLPKGWPSCHCWAQCRPNPSCLAVSAVTAAAGDIECRFSQLAVHSSELMSLPAAVHFTYYKVCEGPFISLPPYGSFLFCPLEKTFDSASRSCPPNSALAAPSDSATFRSLASYMKMHALGSDWWVNIRKDSDGIWRWADGESTMEKGFPWSSTTPDDGGTVNTARMTGPPNYELNDRDSLTQFKFICNFNP